MKLWLCLLLYSLPIHADDQFQPAESEQTQGRSYLQMIKDRMRVGLQRKQIAHYTLLLHNGDSSGFKKMEQNKK